MSPFLSIIVIVIAAIVVVRILWDASDRVKNDKEQTEILKQIRDKK